jgi:hypothetical protein
MNADDSSLLTEVKLIAIQFDTGVFLQAVMFRNMIEDEEILCMLLREHLHCSGCAQLLPAWEQKRFNLFCL